MTKRTLFERLLSGDTDSSDGSDEYGLSLAHFARVVEIAAEAIISVDERHSIILYNRGAEEIFGYAADEVLGRPLAMLLPDRFRPGHSQHVERFGGGSETARHMGERREIAGLTKSGREFPAEASISKFDTPDGRVYTVVLRDVSKQRRDEHTQRFLANASDILARSLEYEATMEGLARLSVPHLADWCVIDTVGDDGRFRRVAAAHSDSAKDALAQRLLEHPPEAGDRHPTIRVLETGKTVHESGITDAWIDEVAAGDAHGALLRELGVASVLVVPLRARDRVLGAFMLVTGGDRSFDADDVELGKELGRRAGLAADNARLYRAAREAVAARDEVLGVVSHDLGNPLSAIRVAARVMDAQLDRGNLPAVREMVGAVRDASGQMERLIRDLLEIQRIESGRLRLVCQDERVAGLVGRAIQGLQGVAAEQGVALEQDLHPDLPETVWADADRVRQIFDNFIGNALKFTPEGGTITVGAEPSETGVRFWVRDTGPGMPSDQLEHVFDRYWQARQHGRPGVGLGLAIARGMAEAHGGSVAADSEEDVGSTFSFQLPAGPPP